MAECQRCGKHVTTVFQRVFAGDDGAVHGCPECMTQRAIYGGDATRDTGDADRAAALTGERHWRRGETGHE